MILCDYTPSPPALKRAGTLANDDGSGVGIKSFTVRHVQCSGARDETHESCGRCHGFKSNRDLGRFIAAWIASEDLLEFYSLKLEDKDDAASNFSEGEAMQRDFRQCGFQVIGRTQISDIYAYPLGELRNFLVERFNRKDLFTQETMRYYHMYVKTLLGPSTSTPKDHWSRI